MSEIFERAKERIGNESSVFKGDEYEEVMASSIADALVELCGKEDEFAQAVVNGKDFTGCMKAVRSAVKGNALSDIDAYCAAAAYYFPGCTVRMRLEINMCGEVDQDAYGVPEGGVVIDLASFL